MIISIEAKMYDTVKSRDLLKQLDDQHENVLKPLRNAFPNARGVQVALLPVEMGITAKAIQPVTLLLWEQIVDTFSDVASASYFCGVLDLALKN